MNKYIYIAFFSIAFILNACRNCNGHNFSINSINLSSQDSLADTTLQDFSIPFFLSGETMFRKGEGKCANKELPVTFANQWIITAFRFSSNAVLTYKNDTFPAFSDLMPTPLIDHQIVPSATTGDIDPALSHLRIKDFNPVHKIKPYVFYIEGHTSDNKTFKDSCTIFIR